jgi:hypothetical protein
MTITRKEAAEKLIDMKQENNGKLFSVLFVKRTTGELRRLCGRFGVEQYLKGGQAAYNFLEKGLVCVFDIEKMAYRTINLETLLELNIQGETYKVENQ